ncbi:hypothetical protein [Spiroplasma endosymbiont of Aleiodes alternator]|uniref:hypothetical protein n=1 Tax=Spiroplasma endosymbiont of Aleiodes alternator TaxID=3139329 RepID=UPI003CCAA840
MTKGAASGALYINPIAQISALVTATVAGGVSVVSDRSKEQLETDMITAAATGAAVGAITFGIDAAKKNLMKNKEDKLKLTMISLQIKKPL